MRLLYRVQRHLPVSGPEVRAAAVLLVLLLCGLVVRHVRQDSQPFSEATYRETERLLREGTALADSSGAVPMALIAPAEGTGSGERLDLNGATAAELELLPRIGPALARRIVEYRTSHGYFREVRELTHVSGIGPKILEQVEPWVYVAPGAGP